MKILVVVDAQNDFVDGVLGSDSAQNAIPYMVEEIKKLTSNDRIFVTHDTHGADYLSTNEGKHLPIEHCIIGTEGWEIYPEIQKAINATPAHLHRIIKSQFGSLELLNKIKYYYLVSETDLDIELIGLCTDICVITNALLLKTKFPEARISVCANACAGSTPTKHTQALSTMESCQIEVI